MHKVEQLREETEKLYIEFVKQYMKEIDTEVIGALMFKYHDTYGIRPHDSLNTIMEAIQKDINNRWKEIIKKGREQYERKVPNEAK